MKLRHQLTYFLLMAIHRWLVSLTEQKRTRVAARIAVILFRYVPVRKTQALTNIQKAFPKKSPVWHHRALKQCYRFFSRSFLHFIAVSSDIQSQNLTVTGEHHLDDALRQGKGLLLVTGHFGNWETIVAWLGHHHYQMAGVAQRQRNQGADRYFRELREHNGFQHIFRKSDSSTMQQVLKDNRILILVSDQDARRHGVFINFFQHPTSTPRGAAVYHRRTGAPIIFTTCYETAPNHYHLTFELIRTNRGAGVQEITQAFTTALETAICNHPEQYFWFHRRWKTRPPMTA